MDDFQKRQRYEQKNRFLLCKDHIAEAIRKHDSNAESVARQMVHLQDPIEDEETLSLLLSGALPLPESISDPDPGRGMERLVCVWHVRGHVDEMPGKYPAYQAELLIAEYKKYSPYVPLGKRVGLKWVPAVSVR